MAPNSPACFVHPSVDGGIALESAVESQQFRFHLLFTTNEYSQLIIPRNSDTDGSN
jgi:hypothetical protein